MNRKKMSICLKLISMIGIALSLPFFVSCVAVSNTSVKSIPPKNIIFMVPDGMGLSNVTIARTYKNGADGAPLTFESLPYIGYQRTYSKNSAITDSAAGASAWASGEKFNNGEISCHDENKDSQCDGTRLNPKTLLELAQGMGMATGLVVTSDITHATPAAWGAHAHARGCGSAIFEQYLEKNIDVLLGGGIAINDKEEACLLPATDAAYNTELINQAVEQGYHHINTIDELLAAGGKSKLLGLFKEGGLTPMFKRGAANTEPTLAQMTSTALDILEENENGFFMLVEGSQVDWGNHARNTPMMIGELLAFDDAVSIVRNWINADPYRRQNTLLIVVADHETGGVIINGPYGTMNASGDSNVQAESINEETLAADPLFDEDGNPVMLPNQDVRHTSTFPGYEEIPASNHTAVDTIIWSNSPACAKAMNNTDLFGIMKNFLKNF